MIESDPPADVLPLDAEPVRARRHWDPQPGDRERIQRHLDRQRDLPPHKLRLDTDEVVNVGADAEGEADNGHY